MSNVRDAAVKRGLDIAVALTGLVLTAPLAALTAGAVLASLGRPVLFRQRRPGLHGQPFELVKFRTMSRGPGTDEERLTSVGKVLRRASLDEIPQLWNVLRGDMSVVGPRPLLMEYLPLYTERQMRRHDVRPGITGWAQVKGRNALSWQERFELDVWYVDHASLRLDLRILALTLAAVATGRGVAHRGEATMARFTGSTLCE